LIFTLYIDGVRMISPSTACRLFPWLAVLASGLLRQCCPDAANMGGRGLPGQMQGASSREYCYAIFQKK